MELPLFPLNSVLFPGMPIRLHIFEERYKIMMNECIDNHVPFGIILIESGTEAMGPLASPYMVGTTAYITQVQKLPFGRMNILAVGRDRFRVQSLDAQVKPYLVGDVEIIPFEDDTTQATRQGSDMLRPLLQRYLVALEKSGAVQFDNAELPDEPLALAYLAAVILQTENDIKQTLLESENTRTLLARLVKMYRKEVVIMDALMSPPADESVDGPFSLN